MSMFTVISSNVLFAVSKYAESVECSHFNKTMPILGTCEYACIEKHLKSSSGYLRYQEIASKSWHNLLILVRLTMLMRNISIG